MPKLEEKLALKAKLRGNSLAELVLKAYGLLFARKIFIKFNKLLYLCSLRGLGALECGKGEVRFLEEYFKNCPGGVVFDVGANEGNYSRDVLTVNSEAIIYAFEPHPSTFKRLKKNLNSENFHAVNVAVGDVETVLSLYDYKNSDGSSHASLFKNVIENIHESEAIEHKVKMISLGSFITSNGIDQIALLKIDVEGNELNVLKGVTDQIALGKISAIHFEFNEMNVLSRVFFRDFWNLLPNYDFYRLVSDGMIKIENYSPVFCEIFGYQNIIAILKKAN